MNRYTTLEKVGILNKFKELFTSYPKNPTEVIYKYIKLTNRKRFVLSVIYNDKVLVEVDTFKHAEFWFPILKISEEKYKNGYSIYFSINNNGIEKNEDYIRYKKSSLNLIELDEKIETEKIKTFVKIIEKTRDPVYLGKEIKSVIDQVYFFEEKEPKVDFKITKIPK